MPPRFVYEALQSPNTEIRLLELLPGTNKTKIQCRLFHCPISNLPAYQPLSYVWGSPTDVAASAANASYILWIDAVCINQEDVAEKSRQIPLLASIYQRGEQTIIWLGPHDRKTARAFEMLKFLARYVERTPKKKPRRIHPDQWQILWRAMRKADSAEMEKNEVYWALVNPVYSLQTLRAEHARISVFGRSWFKRVWVVQELAMSQRAVVVCGKFSINWETVEKAYEASMDWAYWEDGKFLRALIEMRANIQSVTRESISSVILKAINFQATKPVDRIYAILGLAASSPPGFKIDYRAETDTKFVEATRACLRLTGDVGLVLTGCRNRLGKGSVFPSWAWSPEPDSEQPTTEWQFHRGAATRCGFQAAGKESSTSSIQFSEDERLIFLRGTVLDEIIDVGPIFGKPIFGKGKWCYHFSLAPRIFMNDEWDQPVQFWFHPKASLTVAKLLGPGMYPAKNETRLQALISFFKGIFAMCDGSTIETTGAAEWWLSEAVNSPVYRSLFGSSGDPSELFCAKEIQLDSEIPDPKPGYRNALHVKESRQQYMGRRRIVRTSQGYIGLCDRNTEVGDRVALIEGICVPVILRPAPDNRWRIVGESYIYGLMHGEQWDADKAQTLCIE